MLVKCVCSSCSHSYLADDQMGDLACPRCGSANEGSRNPSDIPDAPMQRDAAVYDGFESFRSITHSLRCGLWIVRQLR